MPKVEISVIVHWTITFINWLSFQHDVCRAFHDFINFINHVPRPLAFGTEWTWHGVHRSHIVIDQSASGTWVGTTLLLSMALLLPTGSSRCMQFRLCVGLGDDWGHRIVNTTTRDKELGSQILQVRYLIGFRQLKWPSTGWYWTGATQKATIMITY